MLTDDELRRYLRDLEADKPMFALRPGDGAFGGHQAAVADCKADFNRLAHRIMAACGMPLTP
ncbi:MAG: hypothetical protein WCI94_06770 [Rhodospirillales bacterium]